MPQHMRVMLPVALYVSMHRSIPVREPLHLSVLVLAVPDRRIPAPTPVPMLRLICQRVPLQPLLMRLPRLCTSVRMAYVWLDIAVCPWAGAYASIRAYVDVVMQHLFLCLFHHAQVIFGVFAG